MEESFIVHFVTQAHCFAFAMKFRISLRSMYSILSLRSSLLIFPEFSLMFASHVPRKSKSKFICNTNFQTASRFMRTMMITATRVMHWLLGNVFGFWCTRAIRNNAKRKKPNERRHELEIWDSHLNNHMWYGEDGVLSSFFIFELTAAFFFNQR